MNTTHTSEVTLIVPDWFAIPLCLLVRQLERWHIFKKGGWYRRPILPLQ